MKQNYEKSMIHNSTIQHFLIKGENKNILNELKELENKISLIYIDPPYNTGTKLTYMDKFERADWLKFMKERLEKGKELLNKDGIILISIDNREYPYLKILCDEIFGEENAIGPFVWKKTGQQQNKGKNLAIVTEYIICYAKELVKKGKKKDLFKKESIHNRKGIKAYRYEENGVKFRVNPVQDKTLGKHSWSYINPITKKEINGKYWRLPLNKFTELDKNGMIYWGDGKCLPQVKKFLEEDSALMSNYIDGFYNEQGALLLRSLIDKEFTNPKPLELLEYLIKQCSPENGIVLDFFGGSGTTLHAVLSLNQKGANRQGILITKDESNIFDEITWKRIFKVNEEGYSYKNNTFDATKETVLVFEE